MKNFKIIIIFFFDEVGGENTIEKAIENKKLSLSYETAMLNLNKGKWKMWKPKESTLLSY